MRSRARNSVYLPVALSVAILTVAACGVATPSAPVAPTPSVADSASPAADGSSSVPSCLGQNVTGMHQVPDLEETLPSSVGGRPLATWSVAGRCFIEAAFNLPSDQIDSLITDMESAAEPERVDVSHLTYGVAGRSDTAVDPPYFVFVVGRPQKQAEVETALFLLFGLVGFLDVENAPDLSRYQERSIADHSVYVGDPGMLRQTEHQRGRPYLYQTDDYMFLIITDDDRWAEEAIGQLP
jgi:hypothetical protein